MSCCIPLLVQHVSVPNPRLLNKASTYIRDYYWLTRAFTAAKLAEIRHTQMRKMMLLLRDEMNYLLFGNGCLGWFNRLVPSPACSALLCGSMAKELCRLNLEHHINQASSPLASLAFISEQVDGLHLLVYASDHEICNPTERIKGKKQAILSEIDSMIAAAFGEHFATNL